MPRVLAANATTCSISSTAMPAARAFLTLECTAPSRMAPIAIASLIRREFFLSIGPSRPASLIFSHASDSFGYRLTKVSYVFGGFGPRFIRLLAPFHENARRKLNQVNPSSDHECYSCQRSARNLFIARNQNEEHDMT